MWRASLAPVCSRSNRKSLEPFQITNNRNHTLVTPTIPPMQLHASYIMSYYILHCLACDHSRCLLSALRVVLLLIAAITSQQLIISAGDIETNPGPLLPFGRPELHQLITFRKPDGTVLKVIRDITSHKQWECVDFANMLLRDRVLVKKYENDYKEKNEFVREVLQSWLSQDDHDSTNRAVSCTWAALADCITDAGLNGTLAKAIRDTFLLGSPSGDSSIEVYVEPNVPEDLQLLMTEYSCMLCVLQTTELSPRKLRMLTIFLSGICDDMKLKTCTSLELVIERLVEDSRIYIFNIDTLILCCRRSRRRQFIENNMSQAIHRYKQHLDTFLSSNSVLELQKSLQIKVPNPKKLEPITLKLDKTANIDTLSKLNKLVYHFFGNTSKALIFHKVRRGCVCVTWVIRSSLVSTLREKAEQLSPEYLASKGVLELVIGLRIAPNEAHDPQIVTRQEDSVKATHSGDTVMLKKYEADLEAVQKENDEKFFKPEEKLIAEMMLALLCIFVLSKELSGKEHEQKPLAEDSSEKEPKAPIGGGHEEVYVLSAADSHPHELDYSLQFPSFSKSSENISTADWHPHELDLSLQFPSFSKSSVSINDEFPLSVEEQTVNSPNTTQNQQPVFQAHISLSLPLPTVSLSNKGEIVCTTSTVSKKYLDVLVTGQTQSNYQEKDSEIETDKELETDKES